MMENNACEIQVAPPLKKVNVIKDEYKVGSTKFMSWLMETINKGSTFSSHTQPYNKTYKILDPLEVVEDQELPNLNVEVIDDENPRTKEIGKIIKLSPNDIIDLVGKDQFSKKGV